MFDKWESSGTSIPHQDFFDMNKADLLEELSYLKIDDINDDKIEYARDKFLAKVREHVRKLARDRTSVY